MSAVQTFPLQTLCTYLALAAHLVALSQALLLGGTHVVPQHDVVTQGHMHAAATLSLACTGARQIKDKTTKTQRMQKHTKITTAWYLKGSGDRIFLLGTRSLVR